jgi:pyruvate dehydrogenase (quinone)
VRYVAIARYRFSLQAVFAADCWVAQIDIRPENLGRRCKLDLGVVGDIRLTIEALLSQLETKTERRHLDNTIGRYKGAREGLDASAQGTAGRKPIHPQYLARVINEQAAEDAIFTADVDMPIIGAARYLKMSGRRRLIGSFTHGSMANAMPQAMCAQAAQSSRQVVSLSGDGGFTMLLGDLIMLTQMKLVKVVIFNKGVLGFVAIEMKDFPSTRSSPKRCDRGNCRRPSWLSTRSRALRCWIGASTPSSCATSIAQ